MIWNASETDGLEVNIGDSFLSSGSRLPTWLSRQRIWITGQLYYRDRFVRPKIDFHPCLPSTIWANPSKFNRRIAATQQKIPYGSQTEGEVVRRVARKFGKVGRFRQEILDLNCSRLKWTLKVWSQFRHLYNLFYLPHLASQSSKSPMERA